MNNDQPLPLDKLTIISIITIIFLISNPTFPLLCTLTELHIPSYLHRLNNCDSLVKFDHGCKRIRICLPAAPLYIQFTPLCLCLLAAPAQLTDFTTIQLASKLAAAGPPPPGGYGPPPPQGGYPPQQGQKAGAYVCFSPPVLCIYRKNLFRLKLEC